MSTEQDVLIFLRHDTCENHDKCEPCKGVRRMAIAEIERLQLLAADYGGQLTAMKAQLAELREQFRQVAEVMEKDGRFPTTVKAIRATVDVPAKHDPKCKPDFPFHLCPVCYPGL